MPNTSLSQVRRSRPEGVVEEHSPIGTGYDRERAVGKEPGDRDLDGSAGLHGRHTRARPGREERPEALEPLPEPPQPGDVPVGSEPSFVVTPNPDDEQTIMEQVEIPDVLERQLAGEGRPRALLPAQREGHAADDEMLRRQSQALGVTIPGLPRRRRDNLPRLGGVRDRHLDDAALAEREVDRVVTRPAEIAGPGELRRQPAITHDLDGEIARRCTGATRPVRRTRQDRSEQDLSQVPHTRSLSCNRPSVGGRMHTAVTTPDSSRNQSRTTCCCRYGVRMPTHPPGLNSQPAVTYVRLSQHS